MGAKRKDFDTAVDLYDKGLSIQDVADFYGVTRQAMWMALRRRGCEFRPQLKYGEDNNFYRDGKQAPDRVHNITELAIEKGLIEKKTHCENCSSIDTKINSHHADYNKPLDVEWLCSKCHFDWHKKNIPIELTINFPSMPRQEIASRGGSRKEVTKDELRQKLEEATKTYLLTAGVP